MPDCPATFVLIAIANGNEIDFQTRSGFGSFLLLDVGFYSHLRFYKQIFYIVNR